jgi:hypothetical protein
MRTRRMHENPPADGSVRPSNVGAIFAISSENLIRSIIFTLAFFFCRLVSSPLRGERFSMEELAQSVGNEKMPGEFDRDAATVVNPNTNVGGVVFTSAKFAKRQSKFLPMRTLSLIAPRSRNDETNLQSDHDGKMNALSLVGTVLANRYKILETIGVDSFKAHDLTLDQTVMVRQALQTSQRDGDTWRQKVQQLALVRDLNFLNVLDVIFDKSSDFVITEPVRGHSIADLLRERSRFGLEDVLRLVTPLAGALDLAASFSCCPNPISTCWLFTQTRSSLAVDREQRSLSDWPTFFIKLDVWELVRPRKTNNWRFLPSKAQGGGSRGLAARQAALLIYELLGGEKKKEGQVKRWFKPVNELSDAANGILYVGLQGSPLFETSESFFHKLESAIRSGEGGPRALHAPAPQTRAHSVALPDTNDVIRRFNRDTEWLATLVMGTLVCAALMLAVLVQDRHPKAVDPTEKAVQAGGDFLLNANSATLFKDVDLNSTGEITSGQASSVDHAFTEISQMENPSSQMEAAASTPTPVLAFTPEINHIKAQANASSWSPAHWQDPVRVIRQKIRNLRYRSSVVFRSVNVKMRLIALWHQSLARSEKSRSWTAFSNLNKGVRRKAAYTAETNH